MHKILLVEDDAVIRQQVKKMLEQWGFEVIAVEDFMQVLTIFVKEEPHLVLMDIGLPLFNGYHWCQEIRKISKVPIMFLSSRDQAMDIVMAINMGGDDFVTKPFDNNVLLAKVQGLLRRSYEFGTDQSLLEYHGVILNLKSMDMVYEGEVITLTKNEFQILRVLFEHSGSIVRSGGAKRRSRRTVNRGLQRRKWRIFDPACGRSSTTMSPSSRRCIRWRKPWTCLKRRAWTRRQGCFGIAGFPR